MHLSVIGGSGFIGSRLCQRLFDKNFSFHIIDKAESHLFPDKCSMHDISLSTDFAYSMHSSSCIINLAAEHRDDVSPKSLYWKTNVDGAANVCAVANKAGINTIIFTSSVAVYGFARPGTNESGVIAPFNDYGLTKWEAEGVYKKWHEEDALNRTLVIIRPTVVFGERNRGNVFNLLKQIASGKFVMVGDGLNRKSMAYVENIAAFLEYSTGFKPGVHIYNYIDKPDFTMNMLVGHVNKLLGRASDIKFRIPAALGVLIGVIFDFAGKVSGRKFPISAIRVKKFCTNSVYETAIDSTDFVRPVPMMEAIEKTIHYEFIEDHSLETVFYSE